MHQAKILIIDDDRDIVALVELDVSGLLFRCDVLVHADSDL